MDANGNSFLPTLSGIWHSDKWLDLSETQRKFLKLLFILILFSAGTWLVYLSGGTGYAYPYVLLLPLLLSTAWFALPGAILSAITGGLLLGPLMPLDVSTGTYQTTENWLARVAFFLVIAVIAAALFNSLKVASQQRLHALKFDQKTGLRTQAALTEDVRRLLQNTGRGQVPRGAILLVRMQDLWEIFQSMGADIAEQFVKTLAEQISKSIEAPHRVYRFSKSELAILLTVKSHDEAVAQEEVGEVFDVAKLIGEEETFVKGIPFRVQIVAGSYLVKDNDKNPEIVINRGRTGLSVAMENNVPYRRYDPMFDQKTAERVQLIARVRDGLAKQQFQLFFQPKLCLRSGRHVGSEALLRWFDNDNKMVMPGLFMPKVESTSLIDPVTRFVIARACENIRQHDLLPTSVNFAVDNLMNMALVSDLGRIVESYGVSTELLEIEITEGALIRDPEQAKSAVRILREQGFKVSLDDFGTGYSSFQYLTHLPLSGLKIDRAFVENLEVSANARTIMGSMISMAKALNLEVTVEGIETDQQQEIVADLGADLAQGFHFSRPVPLADYVKWTKSRG